MSIRFIENYRISLDGIYVITKDGKEHLIDPVTLNKRDNEGEFIKECKIVFPRNTV